MKRNTIVVFLAGGLTLLLIGCGKSPFATRSSEEPRTTGGTYTDPVTPAVAVNNLFHSCDERNIVNYSRCLADSFLFVFDFLNIGQPGDVVLWPLGEETRIANNVFHSLSAFQLIWAPSQNDLEGDTLAVYYRGYEITAISSANPPETTRYAGETVLFLSLTESSRWSIYRWEDRHHSGQSYSWADLKARYR